MKRIALVFSLLLMTALPMTAEHVTPETARKAALTFLNNNGAKAAQLTDLSKAAGFPNLYIFTAEQSFVVMSANDCAKPILGYSLTDCFAVDDMPENMRWWLQGYDDQIADAIANKANATTETTKQWKALESEDHTAVKAEVIVEPLIQTKWDQNKYYNRLCPTASGGPDGHVYAGCVATAMAQVMKYWNYPTTGNGEHSYTHATYGEQSVNFGETTYDWINMPISLNNSSSLTQINAVATLLYHCGVSVDMNYGAGSSGAASSAVPNALIEYFRYSPSAKLVARSSYSDEQWIAFLKCELNESRPLYYSGSNTGSGHAFVCDGYRSDNYFHFNWGWSGSDGSYGNSHGNNGYWAIGALSPGSGGSGSGSGSYNLNNSVIAWVEPISALTAPTLAIEVSDNTITLLWDAITNADSYDVYKDNNKIATGIIGENYTDSDVVFGENHEYYIRAVCGESRSNPSNRVKGCIIYRDYTPSSLTASFSNNHASLTWNPPMEHIAKLQYSIDETGIRYGMGEGKDTYWTEVFPPQSLADYAGMYIEKVSSYIYLPGTYTLLLYQGDTSDESNKLYEESFDISGFGYGWKDITLSTPIQLDCTKDLWVIMYYPYTEGSIQTYWYPITSGDYEELSNYTNEDDEFYNPRLLGESLETWYYAGDNNVSWLFKTYLTDGTYTYNLYDGDTKLNEEAVSSTTFTHENPDINTVHQYTVTTNHYGGESAASNMAGLTLGTASLASLELGENDKMTVTEGSQLTVSGTLSDVSPANLIIEDGAQLVNSSEGVKATVKKNITAYTAGEKDGWHLIASPVIEGITPTVDNGLLANEYDLYAFDQSQTQEWRNYKANSFSALEHKKGYLYANSGNPTLSLSGPLAANVEATTLVYDTDASYAGFNLIGNPYPCETYVTGHSFYVLQEGQDGSEFVVGSNPIPPCAAILVQTTAEEVDAETNTVTFSKTAPTTPGKSIDIAVTKANTRGDAILDKARVSFNTGEQLTKYNFGKENAKIYIPMDGKDLAVACANGKNEIPVNFKATQNGTYTLTVEVEGLDTDYLHLIDNMTGDDVDLQETPSYTFEAKTSDYVSRFRLLFAPIREDADGDDETFAYVNNGEIVITDVETFQETSLQVVDMMGRVIASHCGRMRCFPTTGMTPGVYVLRLITGDNVKTQKIVIE